PYPESGPVGTSAPVPLFQSLTPADVDGDGRPDLLLVDYDTQEVLAFLNDGAGNFGAAALTCVLPAHSRSLVLGAATLDGDGRPDLLVVWDGELRTLLSGPGAECAGTLEFRSHA